MIRRTFLFSLACCPLLSGCGKRIDKMAAKAQKPPPVLQDKSKADTCLSIVLDVSPSFAGKMFGPDALAFNQLVRLKDDFFAQTRGHGRLVVSQISTGKNSIIYEGDQRDFTKRFNATSFQEFVLRNASGGSSRVYLSLAECIDYTADLHSGPVRASCVCCFSDMEDNHGHEDQLIEALKRYAPIGTVAIYYAEQHEGAKWRRKLKDVGFNDGNSVIVSGFSHMKLPLPKYVVR